MALAVQVRCGKGEVIRCKFKANNEQVLMALNVTAMKQLGRTVHKQYCVMYSGDPCPPCTTDAQHTTLLEVLREVR